MHPFEAAGLGKPPYSFHGISHNVGPITLASGAQAGAPGQPMGCCRYCGRGIAYEYWLKSSDGHEFCVGCDCIRKTDPSLDSRIKVSVEQRQLDRVRRNAHDEQKSAELYALIERIKPQLQARERERWDGGTEPFLDYLNRSLSCCGASGRARWLRDLKKMFSA